MVARKLGLALLGMTLLGLSLMRAAAEPPAPVDKKTPPDAAELAAPKIRIVSAERTTAADIPWISFACEASNPNKSPLMFVGYRADSFDPPIAEGQISPIYRLEFRREGKWKEHPIGWCGTGMDGIELPAGATRKFSIMVPVDLAGPVARAGIRWSRPIEFDTAPAGAFQVAWSEPFELKDVDGANEKEATAKPSATRQGNVIRLVPSGATFEIPKGWAATATASVEA